MWQFSKFFISLLILAAFGCQKRESAAPAKPTVLVSVPSYLYFVERIAGDSVTALSLTPPGSNPHIYEPSPKEVQHFRQAALWIRLGEPSDVKTHAVLKEQSPDMRIVDIADGIATLPLCEGHCHDHDHDAMQDLHIWLSPRLAIKQAETIAQHLSRLLPEHRSDYEKKLALFLEELRDLDREITEALASKSGSSVLVSHPAFAYFCQDYHITQLSIEVEGKEALPQDVTALLALAKMHHIASVIAEPQYSDKGAKLIAENLKVPVYTIDPYSREYMTNLRFIAEVMAKS
jgi:zinc transport system substrate-binding protein